ncbi:MAG: hypothetical protein AWU57_76 [Marinobacter sp. T13-3]|nr:MAG: hypothetical protein AWU57_76 [Marinobacter sp. T13-3]
MEKRTPAWKTGCLHQVTPSEETPSRELHLSRERLFLLCPQLKALMSGDLVITVSPDWQALNLYAEPRWDILRRDLQALPTDNSEARRIQRRMLGNAIILSAEKTVVIPDTLVNYAGLVDAFDSPLWMIVFDDSNAELWPEHELKRLFSEAQWGKSPLIRFMRGEQVDHRGRSLNDILALDDFWLEHTHDYVQWLFPIDTPSRANLQAPVLNEADQQWFRRDPFLRFQHRRALDRMLRFCGLKRAEHIIEPREDLHPYRHIWLKRGGHNHLLITRMIRSLHLCHQPELARVVQQAFIEIGQARGYVQPQTIAFWRQATE